MKKIRITVVGDGDTGKTCMLIAYKDKVFNEQYIPTVFDLYSMNIPIDGIEYTVLLSDTAGQEEYDKLRRLAYREVDVFILCYAINDYNSFDNVREKWAPELKKCCPHAKIILAGTKCDLPRKIRTDDGMKLRKDIGAAGFIENSAKKIYNINETISLALTAVVAKHTQRKSRHHNNNCNLL